ncbi:MAG: hypothetical protein LBD02_05250 [Christensenellaceae bacterium]|nr:hypothetical protein [Christensenellaceae bacterium]
MVKVSETRSSGPCPPETTNEAAFLPADCPVEPVREQGRHGFAALNPAPGTRMKPQALGFGSAAYTSDWNSTAASIPGT